MENVQKFSSIKKVSCFSILLSRFEYIMFLKLLVKTCKQPTFKENYVSFVHEIQLRIQKLGKRDKVTWNLCDFNGHYSRPLPRRSGWVGSHFLTVVEFHDLELLEIFQDLRKFLMYFYLFLSRLYLLSSRPLWIYSDLGEQ